MADNQVLVMRMQQQESYHILGILLEKVVIKLVNG